MSKAIVRYKVLNLESLDTLTPQEKRVIQMRLGVGCYNKKHTLNEISVDIGGNLSAARVRHIESKAIRKLLHPARKAGFYWI